MTSSTCRRVLTGYSRGTQGVLEGTHGYSWGTQGDFKAVLTERDLQGNSMVLPCHANRAATEGRGGEAEGAGEGRGRRRKRRRGRREAEGGKRREESGGEGRRGEERRGKARGAERSGREGGGSRLVRLEGRQGAGKGNRSASRRKSEALRQTEPSTAQGILKGYSGVLLSRQSQARRRGAAPPSPRCRTRTTASRPAHTWHENEIEGYQ
jgi:hypothetical protein